MKLRQKLALCSFTLLTLASFPTDALASCPSMQQGPPCQEYWRADAVFIGVANRVVNVPNNTLLGVGPYLQTTAYFTIEEAFKGVGGTGIVFDSTNCGYLFKEGERYLVYAHRNSYKNNELIVTIGNTRTRPLSEAVEDLKYIRGLSSVEPGSRIFGQVAQHTHNIKESSYDVEPLQNIKVILEWKDHHQEVVTDSEGKYEFRRTPEGTYQIRAEVPAYLSSAEQKIKVSGKGCVPLDIGAGRKGQIAGRVLDMNRNPLRSVPVSLVSADATPDRILYEGKDKSAWTTSWTNYDGGFRFSQLAPGRYLLVINRAEFERSLGSETSRALPRLFYPGVNDAGGATVIVVGKDDEPQEYEFRLPIPQ